MIFEFEGVWILTDYNNPERFEDTWEFKKDGSWHELKYESDFDERLTPHEFGEWKINGDTLKINYLGDHVKFEKEYIPEPKLILFLFEKENKDVKLLPINLKEDQNIYLRLKRRI